MSTPPERNDDTEAILARRRFLIQSTLAGLGVGAAAISGCANEPEPCLSVEPGPEPKPKDDPKVCLKTLPPEPKPCLTPKPPEPKPCLSPPEPKPCLEVPPPEKKDKPEPKPCLSLPQPCLSVVPRPAPKPCLKIIAPKEDKRT